MKYFPDFRQSVNKFSTSAAKFRRKKDGRHGPISSLPPSIKRPKGEKNENEVRLNINNPLALFKPVLVKPNPDDINFGEELAGI